MWVGAAVALPVFVLPNHHPAHWTSRHCEKPFRWRRDEATPSHHDRARGLVVGGRDCRVGRLRLPPRNDGRSNQHEEPASAIAEPDRTPLSDSYRPVIRISEKVVRP